MIVNNELTVDYAVQALQQCCSRGEVGAEEARTTLASFGGIPYTNRAGKEIYLFVGQVWDVEVITSREHPERCIIWRTMTPD
jgi:hypothetical protein